MIDAMWVWTRIASTKWEDAWAERLRFAGEERVTFYYFPHSARMRIQVYCDHKKTAQQVKQLFGGDWKELKKADWMPQMTQKRKPIPIRGKLLLCTEKPEGKKETRGIPLIIPAGMAFGTGEHATTASCLRLLCDIHEEFPENWRMLDLGTGSGILAIAGEKLGAAQVDALDFDPACVRTTKTNARVNRCKRLNIRQVDVLKSPLSGKYDVVTANLFSDVLIQASAAIAGRLKKSGWLILSGILRTQLDSCLIAFKKKGIRIERTLLRGKWATVLGKRE